MRDSPGDTTGRSLMISPTRWHAPAILDLSTDELAVVMRHTQQIAHAVAVALDASGLNVFQNSGVTAGQTVAHYHVHVLPSHPGNDPSRFIRPRSACTYQSKSARALPGFGLLQAEIRLAHHLVGREVLRAVGEH